MSHELLSVLLHSDRNPLSWEFQSGRSVGEIYGTSFLQFRLYRVMSLGVGDSDGPFGIGAHDIKAQQAQTETSRQWRSLDPIRIVFGQSPAILRCQLERMLRV